MTKRPDNTDKPIAGIFNDSFPPILDGVATAVVNYARWLGPAGFSPVVITPSNPEAVPMDFPTIRYFSLPIFNRRPYRYGYPKLDPFIWRKIRNTPFSILHSHCPFSSGHLALYAKKKLGVPLIATFHSKYRTDLEHSFRHTPWMVPIIMRRILDFFNACDEVWIPQKEVEATVREYGYKGELSVVENGIDFAGLSDDETERLHLEARQRLGISPSTLSLIFVGQHILAKGVEIIICALAMLPPETDFRMDFIGTGYAADSMKKLSKELGLERKVTFHGMVTDRETLRDYYAASDLFLFPSFYDNAPLVVREAASLGTPAVLPAGSTAAEVIVDGQNGFLTSRTPEDYASLIKELYRQKERITKAGLGARHSIVRSWEDVVGEVSDRYRSLIRRKG